MRSRRLDPGREVLVFPTPVPCAEPGGDRGRMGGRGRQSSRPGAEGETVRIVEYTGREPMKLIHWKLTARQDELKVKQLSEVTREPVVLRLEDMPGATLRDRLQCASYQVNRLFRQGRPFGLRLQGRHFAPALGRHHKLRMLAELAVHDQD